MSNVVSEQVKRLIVENDLRKAFDVLLKTVNEDSDLYRLLISTYSRYRQLESHQINGTLHTEMIQMENNKIRSSLFKILDELNYTDFEPDLEAKIYIKEQSTTKTLPEKETLPELSFWERIVKWFKEKF